MPLIATTLFGSSHDMNRFTTTPRTAHPALRRRSRGIGMVMAGSVRPLYGVKGISPT
jgi:hypothetical protein